MQQLTSLKLTPDRREAVVHGTPSFPCAAYFSDLALLPARSVSWHWHEEIELGMVVGGAARIRTVDEELILRAGEGVFINSEALHDFKIVGDEGCRMIALVLDHSMLSGSDESVFARRYVQPLIDSHEIRLIPLHPGSEWQQEVLRCLREAFLSYDEGKYGFELIVRARLTECLWHIVRNARLAIRDSVHTPSLAEERVKNMLDYIHLHFAEPVQLSEIAAAASIGERECLRAFQKTLGMTPLNCLLRYRVSIAAQMLLDTDQSIAEICFNVGFNSQSHFGQIFKRYFNMTPREYRARAQKKEESV